MCRWETITLACRSTCRLEVNVSLAVWRKESDKQVRNAQFGKSSKSLRLIRNILSYKVWMDWLLSRGSQTTKKVQLCFLAQVSYHVCGWEFLLWGVKHKLPRFAHINRRNHWTKLHTPLRRCLWLQHAGKKKHTAHFSLPKMITNHFAKWTTGQFAFRAADGHIQAFSALTIHTVCFQIFSVPLVNQYPRLLRLRNRDVTFSVQDTRQRRWESPAVRCQFYRACCVWFYKTRTFRHGTW